MVLSSLYAIGCSSTDYQFCFLLWWYLYRSTRTFLVYIYIYSSTPMVARMKSREISSCDFLLVSTVYKKHAGSVLREAQRSIIFCCSCEVQWNSHSPVWIQSEHKFASTFKRSSNLLRTPFSRLEATAHWCASSFPSRAFGWQENQDAALTCRRAICWHTY